MESHHIHLRYGPCVYPTIRQRILRQHGLIENRKRMMVKTLSKKSYLTCPIVIETAEVLTKEETVPSPIWSSFCGSVGGLWLGYRGVYAPFTGKPEPIALTEGKKKVYHVSQCCVEDRELRDDGVDCIVRHEARSSSRLVLEEHMRDAGKLDFAHVRQGDDDEYGEWDTDVIERDEDGLFIFDGGSYSRGPLNLCTMDGDDAEYAVKDDVRVIESCMQWNGEERVRVSVTIASELLEPEDPTVSEDPELDVSLLRVAVNRETWEGLPGQYTSSSQSESDEQSKMASGETRIPQEEMQGFWNVFEVDVCRVEDIDMKTGNLATLSVYTSQEFQKIFQLGDMFLLENQGQDAPSGCALDGGTLWLPHRVILQVSTPPEGGVEISMLWSPDCGKFLSMTRTYSVLGEFLQASCATGIKK
jgi:hypothetical protein